MATLGIELSGEQITDLSIELCCSNYAFYFCIKSSNAKNIFMLIKFSFINIS